VALLVLVLAGATPSVGRTGEQPCDWGASSVAGKVVNGSFVVTTPVSTTGCVPAEPTPPAHTR
jgi:hypothetical protein